MPKAINWPIQFLDNVQNGQEQQSKIALRIGSLYYDNEYYCENEIIDIRVDHKIIRPGLINGKMELKAIKDLTQEDIQLYMEPLDSHEKIADFLGKNYNKDVSLETIVTIIPYENLAIDQTDVVDDPHLC